MDFTQYKKSNVSFGGSEEKIGIIIDDIDYMLKFQKDSETGLFMNHYSEHIGSTIFGLLGESVQTTTIGTYKGRDVVACKDFKKKGEEFVPFNEVGDSSLEADREAYKYTYNDIISMLEDNKKITNVTETIEKFWNLYIIDALLGNFDRHGANWGFIKQNNKYKMAPVFDNGSCLFPRLNTDKLCKKVMDSEVELNKRTFVYPTSQIKLDFSKSSYYDVISSLRFTECNKALKRIYKRIDIETIEKFIMSLSYLTKIRKEFYIKIIKHRYKNIIKEPYQRLEGVKK